MSMADRILQFFRWMEPDESEKQRIKATRDAFADFAEQINQRLPDNAEKTTCLRKLLEAKDCAVRAELFRM